MSSIGRFILAKSDLVIFKNSSMVIVILSSVVMAGLFSFASFKVLNLHLCLLGTLNPKVLYHQSRRNFRD